MPLLQRVTAILLLALVFVLGTVPASAAYKFKDYPRAKLTPPDAIKSKSALLIDAETGEVLYARNPDAELLPASTTKLMTALVVYEKLGGMKGYIKVDQSDMAEPSNVPLRPGEVVSVNTLFYALLIESANDAARALGRSVAGSPEAFIRMMNDKAASMGLENTHFANPNGLPAPKGTHYTSCADLMKIFRAVVRYPELRAICSTKEYFITSAVGKQKIRNHNKLLGYYPGMGPAKTGWTVASRHCYAASVTRNGHELLLTLLESPNKWQDSQILFDWGFAQYPGSSVPPPAPSGKRNNP